MNTVELVVLATTKVGENAVVVHTLSREYGRRGFMVRPGKKQVSEVLFRTVREGVFEEGLYEWCIGSILTLNALEADFANFHIRFLLELAGALGFRPTFDDIAPFAKEHLQELKPFLQASFSESMLIPLTGASRNALCESLLQYLSYHTESAIQVRSLAVLRELYR